MLEHAAHTSVGIGDVPQSAFCPSQYQRQAVVARRLVDGRKPQFPEIEVKFFKAVLLQHPHHGHIERTDQGPAGRYNSVVVFMIIFRPVTAQLYRYVGYEALGQYLAILQHKRI